MKKLYSGVQQADHVYTECTEQLYKHRCLSVRLSVCLSVCLFICPKFCIQVNVTSTEARQAASSCTVDYNEVLPTQRKWRPMPTQICQPHSATPVRESYSLRLAQMKKCQKRRWPYFSILRGGRFPTTHMQISRT